MNDDEKLIAYTHAGWSVVRDSDGEIIALFASELDADEWADWKNRCDG